MSFSQGKVRKPIRYLTIFWAIACISLVFANTTYAEDEPSIASSQADPEVYKITAVSFTSWWSHDATGYHPAVFLKLENDSGRDLSGQLIQFQSRFTDLRNGYVTIGRKEMRCEFANHQQLYVVLKGPQTFELPIDENLWPRIECKVMCRIGEIGDEGTQTLLITKLESVTMTDEEAMVKLSKQPDIRHSRTKTSLGARFQAEYQKTKDRSGKGSVMDKPLSAKALALSNTQSTSGKNHIDQEAPLLGQYKGSRLPGLGDDFFQFDKTFGKAEQWDSSKNWTWVPYQNTSSRIKLFVGAKNRGAKADMLIAKVPADQVKQHSQVIGLARALSGKFKGQKLSQLSSSVKYLPAGRIEVTNLSALGYRVLFINPCSVSRDDKSYILIVSRLNGDLQATTPNIIRSTRLLGFMVPLFPVD